MESGLRDEKSEFKIVNKFDKWLDMRKVKERLLSLKQDIYISSWRENNQLHLY